MDELVIQDVLTWFLEQNILQLRQIKICGSRNNGRLKDREYARDTLRGRVFYFSFGREDGGYFYWENIFQYLTHFIPGTSVGIAIRKDRKGISFLKGERDELMGFA